MPSPSCTSAPSSAAGCSAPPCPCSEPGGFSVGNKGRVRWGVMVQGWRRAEVVQGNREQRHRAWWVGWVGGRMSFRCWASPFLSAPPGLCAASS